MAAFRGASYARSAEDASGLIEANAAALASVGLPLDFLTGMTKLTVGVWFFFLFFFVSMCEVIGLLFRIRIR